MASCRSQFDSFRVDDGATTECIADTYASTGYLLDPHSAIGVAAAREGASRTPGPWITLATAHPAKFPDAIARAGVGAKPELPTHMADLFDLPEHFEVLPNDDAAVRAFMATHLGA